ncbi:hypothetical protein FRB97_001066 [Tulasnella sp. 331]|nr:hypothetical protein FRB97_001066 [Tulasnella sp. 331]
MGADTLQIVQHTLDDLSIIVNALPIPDPFRSIVVGIPDAVLEIITILETAKGNMEDAIALAVYVATVTDNTIRPLDPINTGPTTRKRIKEFLEVLHQIKGTLRALASQKSRWKQIVNYDRDASTLAAMKQSVADAVTCIQLEITVATNQEVNLIGQKQDVISKDQALMIRKQDRIQEEIKAMIEREGFLYQGQQRIIREQQPLRITEIARLVALLGTQDSGSSRKPPYLDGTRVSLLEKINQWIEERGRRALCLEGSLGIGESSIGSTVAEEQRAFHRLGAEFYFTADQQDRNEAAVLVLARQLASWSKGKLRFEIANAVDEDPEIMRRSPTVQFQKLIQQPLETLSGDENCPTLIMLLDGLDECTKDYSSQLLEALGLGLGKLPDAVKVIITSRPEPHLLAIYQSEAITSHLEIYSLDMEEVMQSKRDIWRYFKEELPRMVGEWVKESLDWPGEDRRTILVELSQGLWIYAMTAARMLADPAIRDPERQLEAIRSSHRHTDETCGRYARLDDIYSAVLNRACPPDSSPDLLALFRDVLGTILVAQVPVNIHTLASLLCASESKLEEYIHRIRTTVLAYLQAVLLVPGVRKTNPSRDALPIHFIHKSFEDYLTDDSRCEPRFLLNLADLNRNMTVRCLTFPGLGRNICDLDPSQLNSEVDAFERRVQHHVSAGLQYACEQWPMHVSREPPESDGVALLLEKFVQTHLLHWLEVVSLVGRMKGLIGSIEMVESWLKAKPSQGSSEPLKSAESTPEPPHHPLPSAVRMLEMLSVNTYRWLRELVVEAALYPTLLHADDQAHRLAITLKSLEQAALSKRASAPPRPPVPPPESYPPTMTLLQELKYFVREFMVPISTSSSHIYHSALPFTPRQNPLSVAYGHLAEGGPRVRRGQLQRWSNREDHSLPVNPDGDVFNMWDTNGPIRDKLKGNGGEVWCTAWSPDGKTIVSGSRKRAPRFWNPSIGAPIGKPYKGYVHGVFGIAWSPDGKTIVSGADDQTLRFWNASTGAPIGEPLAGHTNVVSCTAWSPDSKKVVSGSTDRTLRLWTASTRAPIGGPLEGHTDGIWCTAWSPDSKMIVSGSGDKTLRFWSASTGAPIGEPLKGHSGGISCTAWSPDSKSIVSGSGDTTLRFWSVSTGTSIGKPLRGHTGPVYCVAWSPDGKTVVSGSVDATLRFWNASTGAFLGKGLGICDRTICCVAWSPDGKTIVAGSEAGTLHFWDASTREPLRFGQRWPDSHTHSLYRLAFSPDSRHIVSASADNTLCLWDVESGTLAQKPVNQPLKISSLEFSLDGKYVLLEDEEVQTIWDIAGEGSEFTVRPPARSAAKDPTSVLTIDKDGWLLDGGGKRMFWLPVVLRPQSRTRDGRGRVTVHGSGRILVKGNILTIEIPTVPIIDISAYVSNGS